jgi:hypothetical protein
MQHVAGLLSFFITHIAWNLASGQQPLLLNHSSLLFTSTIHRQAPSKVTQALVLWQSVRYNSDLFSSLEHFLTFMAHLEALVPGQELRWEFTDCVDDHFFAGFLC